MIIIYTLFLAIVLTVLLVPICTEIGIMFYVMDEPGENNFLVRPMPKIGGIALVLAACAPLLIWHQDTSLIHPFIISIGVVVLFGIAEDFRGLSLKFKLAGQILAAIIIVWFGGIQISTLGNLLPEDIILPVWFSIPLTIAVIVSATNAVNRSDGMDGLAAGTYLLIFTSIGYIAFLDGNRSIALICLVLCGVLFGFLRFNTYPASIFMGQSGSQFLGFSASTLAIAATQGHATPLSPVLPLILLGFPVLETLTVMAIRIATKKSEFGVNQFHFHHYLMSSGMGHYSSIMIIYVIQTLLLIAAVYFRFYSEWFLVSGYLIFSGLFLIFFNKVSGIHNRLKHFGLFDNRFTSFIRQVKLKGTVIKWIFPFLEVGIPLLLVLTCMFSKSPPVYVTISSAVLACIILISMLLKSRYLGSFLRLFLYLLAPFAIYYSSETLANTSNVFIHIYNLSFAFFAVLIILISILSRRKKGFQNSPLDFLVAVLALLVSNLFDQNIQDYRIGIVVVRTILFYFSFEVLLAGLRERFNKVAWVVVASLLLFAVK